MSESAIEIPKPERRPQRGRSIPTNVLIPLVHRDALRHLSAVTRVSQSEYLREAVADLLKKYRHMAAAQKAIAKEREQNAAPSRLVG